MDTSRIPKQVYDEVVRLNEHGFTNWTSKVCTMINSYNLDVNLPPGIFKIDCKKAVLDNFLGHWYQHVSHSIQNPILRLYTVIKPVFEMIPHLYSIKDSHD